VESSELNRSYVGRSSDLRHEPDAAIAGVMLRLRMTTDLVGSGLWLRSCNDPSSALVSHLPYSLVRAFPSDVSQRVIGSPLFSAFTRDKLESCRPRVPGSPRPDLSTSIAGRPYLLVGYLLFLAAPKKKPFCPAMSGAAHAPVSNPIEGNLPSHAIAQFADRASRPSSPHHGAPRSRPRCSPKKIFDPHHLIETVGA